MATAMPATASAGGMATAVKAFGRMVHLAHETGVAGQLASDQIEDGMRAARRLGREGLHAFEDTCSDVEQYVRREPFWALGLTFLTGAGIGALLGIGGRRVFGRRAV